MKAADRQTRRSRLCGWAHWATVAGIAAYFASGDAMAHTVDYRINQNTASIRFSTQAARVFPVHGMFTRFMGQIRLNPTHPACMRIDMVVDDGGIAAPWNGAKLLKSPAYFDHDRFPVIRFHSDGVEVLPDDQFAITGDLTIRGVTRRQVFEGKITNTSIGGVPAVRLVARSVIDRSAFGMVADQRLIADRVTLDISTTLRAPAGYAGLRVNTPQ